jgi:hypothetical protein
MTPRSPDNEGIHMLPEFVCEAIPAPGLSMPPRTGPDQNGQGSPAPPADGGEKPDDPRPEAPAEPTSEAEGTV